MTANDVFIPVAERGWRRGLRNLMRAGLGEWWGTRTWWLHTVIWTGILSFALSGIVFSSEGASVIDGVGFLCLFGGLFPVVAVMIKMQGSIVGEKQDGTAAWLLAKPVSRTAYILAKLIPNAIGALVTMLLIPMTVGWIVLRVAGAAVTFPHFIGGYLVVSLNMLFFLSLTLMLGAMFKRRGGVIGISLGLLFGQQYLVNAAPILGKVLPWGLCLPLGDDLTTSISGAVMTGAIPPTWLPVFTTLAFTVLFVVVAVWRFGEVEL